MVLAKTVASGPRSARADIERGRESYKRRAWADAYDQFSSAERLTSLAGEDLELMAVSASLAGRSKDSLVAFDRAYHAHLKSGNGIRAARTAFWYGFRLQSLGERGAAAGWFARAKTLIEDKPSNCVEEGYLLLPLVQGHFAAGDIQAAHAVATKALEIGSRFNETDLIAFARNFLGRALMLQGRVKEGLSFLDEAMVAVSARELSPVVTGIIYCTAIDSCHRVYAFGRAREWTSALADWCEEQSQLMIFNGRCLVHRSELMQLNGNWAEAIEEARRASRRDAVRVDRQAAAAALYQEGEVHRLLGEYAQAEEAYRKASDMGAEPQPGFALLRAAQGHGTAAAASIRRVLGAAKDRLHRTRYLPAFVEIMLGAGEIEEALHASIELKDIAAGFESDVLDAMAWHAEGAVALARGNAQAALVPLRRAFNVWHQMEAPYIAARLRVSIGLACHALGDEEGGRLELSGARAVFRELGAAPDIARIDALTKNSKSPHNLTGREQQVLGLVAAGKSNKAIAAQLNLSSKTVDRHVSNIFVKLDVSSRAAATAKAYKQGLV